MTSVLIVEDNEVLQRLMERILTDAGHTVVGIAFDGLDAVEKFKSLRPPPDIILMDQRMPQMSGIEAMIRILSIDQSAKILFLSADNRMKVEALAEGAVGFLVKPTPSATLLNTINNVSTKDGSLTESIEDIT